MFLRIVAFSINILILNRSYLQFLFMVRLFSPEMGERIKYIYFTSSVHSFIMETNDLFIVEDNMETICGFKIHRFVKLFPSMTEEEYQDLKEDIKLNGQIEPVLINSNNEILDGFHRSKCVSELGLNLKTTLYKGTEKDYLNVVISKNLKRRMLNVNQKSLLGVRLLDLFKNDAELRRLNNLKQNQQTPNATRVSLGRSSEQAGKLVGVSHKSIERAAPKRRHVPPLARGG